MACNDTLSPVAAAHSRSPYGPIGSPLTNPVQEDSSETAHSKRLKVGCKTVRFPENPECSQQADTLCQGKRAYKSVLKIGPLSPVFEGTIKELSYEERKAAETERLTALFTQQFQKLLENPQNEEWQKDCTVTLINAKHQFDTALHLVDLQDKSTPKNREALDKILNAYLTTQASATARHKLPDIIKQVEIRLMHANTAEIIEFLVFTRKQTKIDSLALMEVAGKSVTKYPEIKEKLSASYREAFNNEAARLKELVMEMVKQPENREFLAKTVACLIRIYQKGLTPDPTERLNQLFKEIKLNSKQVLYFKKLVLSQFLSTPEGFRYLTQELSHLLRTEIIHRAEDIYAGVSKLIENELHKALNVYEEYGVDVIYLLCTAWNEAVSQCDRKAKGIALGDMVVQSVQAKRLLALLTAQPTQNQHLCSIASCLLALEQHGIDAISYLDQLLGTIADLLLRDRLKTAISLKIVTFFQASDQLKQLFIVELIDNAEKDKVQKPHKDLLAYFMTRLQEFEKLDVKLPHLIDYSWEEAKKQKAALPPACLCGEQIIKEIKAALIFRAKKSDS